MIRSAAMLGQAVRRQKCLFDKRAVKHVFAVGDWTMRYYPPAKKCKLDLHGWGCIGLFLSQGRWLVFNCTRILRFL